MEIFFVMRRWVVLVLEKECFYSHSCTFVWKKLTWTEWKGSRSILCINPRFTTDKLWWRCERKYCSKKCDIYEYLIIMVSFYSSLLLLQHNYDESLNFLIFRVSVMLHSNKRPNTRPPLKFMAPLVSYSDPKSTPNVKCRSLHLLTTEHPFPHLPSSTPVWVIV